ncbi:MAG: hypothetical protein ABSF26_27905 [Thermoguttaceae bacterium]|jgi:hypothetical protein
MSMTMQSEPRKATTRTIRLPCYGITIHLSRENIPQGPASGTIASDLKQPGGTAAALIYNAAADGIEALILAHTCAGVDVESPTYLEGIETAVEAIANHLS